MEYTGIFEYNPVQPLHQEPPGEEDVAVGAEERGLGVINAGEYGRSAVVFRRIIDDHEEAHASAAACEEEEEEELEFITLGEEFVAEEHANVTNVSSKTSIEQATALFKAPWRQRSFDVRTLRSHLLELHQEIVDFCELISPTPEEYWLRIDAIQRVTKVVKSVWKQSQVKVFGSFATGLYLPSSDIDIVIFGSGCFDIQAGLQALAKALTKDGIAKNVQVIGKARVPIVKFLEIESSISFDISFDMESGPDAAKFIKDALTAVPPLKPLCLVLKIFLQQRELNEVYTGGIGSYALLVMLLTYLQTRCGRHDYSGLRQQSKIDHNLGVLLVDFFDLYGRLLNVRDVGISCRDGGRFFKKRERGFFDSKKPFLLTVEDPQAPTNDIAKNSYNFQKVRYAFMLAHRHLVTIDPDECDKKAGLLERIVRVDEKLAKRTREISQLQVKAIEELEFPQNVSATGDRGKKRKWAYEGKHSSPGSHADKGRKWKMKKQGGKDHRKSPDRPRSWTKHHKSVYGKRTRKMLNR